MFRSVCVTLLFLQAVFGFDITNSKSENILFTQKDAVPKGQTKLISDRRASNFIGDLIVGDRGSDEWVFTRVLSVENPSNVVQSTDLNLNVDNGIIHYVSLINEPGSYAVGCAGAYTLGSSSSRINIRVTPNSKSILHLTIAAH